MQCEELLALIYLELFEVVCFKECNKIDKEFHSELGLEHNTWLTIKNKSENIMIELVNDEAFNLIQINCHNMQHLVREYDNFLFTVMLIINQEKINWVLFFLVKNEITLLLS